MTRKYLYGAAAVVACLSAGGYYTRADAVEPQIVTRDVTRGDIIQSVSATGALETVTSVEVGSQVSGTVKSLAADFNSIVHKGQVVATLDPSSFETEVEQARANLIRSQAESERLQVMAADAHSKLQRAEDLSEKKLIANVDLEAAVLATRTAEAQIRSAQAAVAQSQASLQQAQVNLSKTIITSPIDGIVVARNVDIGQTVAASMSAPTLFVIAADLAKMQLNASIDESDVGMIREGQSVSFRVGAFPSEAFSGLVRQLRLNPIVEQNVVTYTAVIDVPNAHLKLKPGMTATLEIEIAKRSGVLRLPNAALQFRPSTEALSALNKTATLNTNATADAQRTGSSAARQVWTGTNGTFVQVPVTTGLSDGTYTELLSPSLTEGAKVVTSVALAGSQQQTRTAGTADPFSSLQGRGRF